MKIDATDSQNRAAAYHEASHVVIACVLGLPIGSKGARIDSFANGQAWFWGATEGVAVPPSKVEAVVIALFAGGTAHQIVGSFSQGAIAGDEWRIKDLLKAVCPNDELREEKYKRLKERSDDVVNEHWATIAVLAEALWALPWVPRNVSRELPKDKMLKGSEIATILAPLAVVIDEYME